MKILLVFVTVLALVATTILTQTTFVQAEGTNAHAHINIDGNDNEHVNSEFTTNEGGKEGFHENAQNVCNENNDKCTSHDNVNDR